MATQITNSPDRQKALSLVLTQIEKSFGKGAIMRLGDAPLPNDFSIWVRTKLRAFCLSGLFVIWVAINASMNRGR